MTYLDGHFPQIRLILCSVDIAETAAADNFEHLVFGRLYFQNLVRHSCRQKIINFCVPTLSFQSVVRHCVEQSV